MTGQELLREVSTCATSNLSPSPSQPRSDFTCNAPTLAEPRKANSRTTAAWTSYGQISGACDDGTQNSLLNQVPESASSQGQEQEQEQEQQSQSHKREWLSYRKASNTISAVATVTSLGVICKLAPQVLRQRAEDKASAQAARDLEAQPDQAPKSTQQQSYRTVKTTRTTVIYEESNV